MLSELSRGLEPRGVIDLAITGEILSSPVEMPHPLSTLFLLFLCSRLSLCLCLSVSLSLSVCASLCLSISLSVCLSVSLPLYLTLFLSICLSACLSVSLSQQPVFTATSLIRKTASSKRFRYSDIFSFDFYLVSFVPK